MNQTSFKCVRYVKLRLVVCSFQLCIKLNKLIFPLSDSFSAEPITCMFSSLRHHQTFQKLTVNFCPLLLIFSSDGFHVVVCFAYRLVVMPHHLKVFGVHSAWMPGRGTMRSASLQMASCRSAGPLRTVNFSIRYDPNKRCVP